MKLPFIALAAVAAALVAVPEQAQAQDIVTTQLDSAVVLMGGRGFTPADEPVRGALAQGDDEEFELDLEDGTEYVVVGVCDGDCSDLDLVLTDDEGEEVESDRAMDDVPVLTISGQSGSFVLSVQMATCSASRCGYGVRVFRSR